MDQATSSAILALEAMMKWSVNFSVQQEDNYYTILNALRSKTAVPLISDTDLKKIYDRHQMKDPLDALREVQTKVRMRCGIEGVK